VKLVILFASLIFQVGTTTYVCWSDIAIDPRTRLPESVTRCRVAGEIVDYSSVGEVPVYLYPDVGSDGVGTCWFWRSEWSGWEIITGHSDGSATLGFDSDGVPGGPLNMEVTYPACVSEPVDGDALEVLVWDLVRDYVHRRPDPVLNPDVPFGLTGVATFLDLDPPPPFAASIVAPVGQLDVEANVAGLTVDWGDGTAVSVPPELFGSVTGYPDGSVFHTYEVKTCDPPGSGSRCHPSLESYPFEVRFRWGVRWRVNGGAWQVLLVPDSVTAVPYPVREVIAVLGESS
jgi:hypothetical protein